MPLSTTTSLHSKTNNIVDQILEQGQRLRNSMVESILNNDPLNTQVVNYKYRYDSNRSDKTEEQLTPEEKELFLAYVRGDTMSKIEEKQALDTFRRMSITDVYNLTDRTCLSYKATCNCDTCKAFYSENKNEKYNVPALNLQNLSEKRDLESEKTCTPVTSLLKYVDSLRISIHSLIFNHEGLKKIYKNNIKHSLKLPPSYTHSYFVEYSVPDILLHSNSKIRAKVDTGMHNNKVRICSKLIHNEVIHFKQSSTHEVIHLDTLELDRLLIKFTISCRTQKQKGVLTIGTAKFKMSSFENTKYLTSNQELAIMLDCDAPIVLGNLKVTIQLGCDKLYFGREFIDAICLNKSRNVVLPETINESEEDNFSEILYDKDVEITKALNARGATTTLDKSHFNTKIIKDNLKDTLKKVINKNTNDVEKLKLVKHKADENTNFIANKQLTFGLICITEAEFLDSITTYFIVRLFGQDDLLHSRVIYHSSNPVYNFHQIIPYLYDDSFVQKLRDNYTIFEFYQKCAEGDVLVGVCKVSLHQFYVSFRNDSIYEYLLKNDFPVIGADWWEPITDPLNGKLYGQVQILIAFGSEKQIQNLELNRGFWDEKVIAKKTNKISNLEKSSKQKSLCIVEDLSKHKSIRLQENFIKENKKTPKSKLSLNKISPTCKKADKASQFDDNMDNIDKINKDQNITVNKDTLGEFLSQLIQQRQTSNCVENSTNTENLPTPEPQPASKVSETSQLLDTLQEALSVSGNTLFCNNGTLNETINSFKTHIFIEKALHLPVKKKCKLKKTKGKTLKQEDVPPSCYVTFETIPNEMKVTPIILKNCNPVWDYRCDVMLPADLLTNNQKRLIFKVWKKCAGNSAQANLQTDIIIGFAALDLTVFLAGLPTISGWFNILDFSSKCNGQIKIDVTPLENVTKFKEVKNCDQSEVNSLNDITNQSRERTEEPSESLSRALKRKFIELDEITQRLRLRLSNVTNDENDGFNDELADEFEHDINTLCVEDDYNLIDFEDETKKSHFGQTKDGLLQVETNNYESETASTHSTELESSIMALDIQKPVSTNNLNRQLQEGKQRIDTLLEKLSIIANENDSSFSSRHVSGCSINQDLVQNSNNGTLKDFVLNNTNMNADYILNPLLFQNLCSAQEIEESDRSNTELYTTESSSASITNCRATPDGAGFMEDKL